MLYFLLSFFKILVYSLIFTLRAFLFVCLLVHISIIPYLPLLVQIINLVFSCFGIIECKGKRILKVVLSVMELNTCYVKTNACAIKNTPLNSPLLILNINSITTFYEWKMNFQSKFLKILTLIYFYLIGKRA